MGGRKRKKAGGDEEKEGNGRGVAPASAPRSASGSLIQFSARNNTKFAFFFGIPCGTPEIKEQV